MPIFLRKDHSHPAYQHIERDIASVKRTTRSPKQKSRHEEVDPILGYNSNTDDAGLRLDEPVIGAKDEFSYRLESGYDKFHSECYSCQCGEVSRLCVMITIDLMPYIVVP